MASQEHPFAVTTPKVGATIPTTLGVGEGGGEKTSGASPIERSAPDTVPAFLKRLLYGSLVTGDGTRERDDGRGYIYSERAM